MTIEDRELESAMAGLLTTAPATLRPGVLVEAGLADWHCMIESPIGPLVVAWNGLGVSAVEAAPDAAAFEASHLERSGRRAILADGLPEALAGAIRRRLAQGPRDPPW